MRLLLAASAIAPLAGCTGPTIYTAEPLMRYDKDTSYRVDNRPAGFSLTISYDRYQFFPETSAVATACKQALTSLAHEVAEKQGRTIKPIDEQRIRISFGRNEFTGITSCSATAPADWSA